MTVYKLHYFNVRGRAEGIRWLFSLAGVEFEDIRIDKSEWPSKKQEMPFGYMPVLEVDGQLLSESQTIGRYLANKFGYAGKTDFEKAQVDQYVDIVYDLMAAVRPINRAPDEQAKAQARKLLKEESGPRILGHFEKCLTSSKSGFLVGDTVTWGDVFLASYVDSFIDRISPEFGQLLEKCPKLKAHLDKIRAIPQIAAFITKRPQTAM